MLKCGYICIIKLHCFKFVLYGFRRMVPCRIAYCRTFLVTCKDKASFPIRQLTAYRTIYLMCLDVTRNSVLVVLGAIGDNILDVSITTSDGAGNTIENISTSNDTHTGGEKLTAIANSN